MLFDAHAQSFTALGGVPRRGIYDNMKTAVDRVHRGKDRVVNSRFAVMCAHYLFDPDFCNVASGWEKGVIEKNVQDSRRRIWLEAQQRTFGSFVELNLWLGQHDIPLVERKPGALRNGAPFAAMPEPLARLKQTRLRRPGGDRIMAQVLAAIPAAGLDAVLVAIELVLESGLVSADPVLNVIARLQAEPQPARVETSLTLKDAPLANTGRDDSLLSAAAREVIPLEAEVTHE